MGFGGDTVVMHMRGSQPSILLRSTNFCPIFDLLVIALLSYSVISPFKRHEKK